jgi:hypothetical protein
VAGTRFLGSVLTVNPGSWSGFPLGDASYQWFRCWNPVNTASLSIPLDCAAISGATGSTYTQTTDDVGRFLSIRESRTNGVSNVAISEVGTGGPPVKLSDPGFVGSLSKGSTVIADPGTWRAYPSPDIHYFWWSCQRGGAISLTSNPDPNYCGPLAWLTDQHTFTSSSVGRFVGVIVTVTNRYGSYQALIPVQVVREAVSNAPSISGSKRVGSLLSVNDGTWSGSPAATFTYSWYRCAEPIDTATTTVPSSCQLIPGQSSNYYFQSTADRLSYVTVLIRGVNPVGDLAILAAVTQATG